MQDFLKGPVAAEAVAADKDATRFWAEVLTGYSSRIPGEQPGQVGPRKIARLLLGHVPNTFVLSVAQRQHLEPAVTAWVRWSAERRGLDEAATARLMDGLPEVLSRFDEAYDDRDAATARSYLAGLAASDADVSELASQVARRMFAVPIPRLAPGSGPEDLSDPAVRQARIANEFVACTPHSGGTMEEFRAGLQRVITELWDGDPAATFQEARRLFAAAPTGTTSSTRWPSGKNHRQAGESYAQPRLTVNRPAARRAAVRRTGAGGRAMSYAEVNGVRMYYEEHGSGQPLILLHGGLGSGGMYGPVLPALAAGRRVITVDLQAHGRTADVGLPLRYETLGDDVAGLIRQLAWPRLI